ALLSGLRGREDLLDAGDAGHDLARAVLAEEAHALLTRHLLDGLGVAALEDLATHGLVDEHELVDALPAAVARVPALLASLRSVEDEAVLARRALHLVRRRGRRHAHELALREDGRGGRAPDLFDLGRVRREAELEEVRVGRVIGHAAMRAEPP